VPEHWELAPRITALRNTHAPGTILLGNGDVSSLEDARARVAACGFDGAMVGKGVFGNPWFFSGKTPSLHERLERMIIHTELFEQLYKSNTSKKNGAIKNFDVMKKHYKAYCSGFDGAKELRIQLMDAENAAEVKEFTTAFLDGGKNKR
jgi:tRNA-dihydrouridine synthase